jgi:NAD(P)H-hydrate epimerase
MATIDTNEEHFSDAGDASHYDVIGIGPGIGVTSSTVSGLRKVLQAHKPMVIDADALNILSGSRELMHLIPPGSILTPHPGEFKRLVGEWKDDFERLELQKRLAVQTKSTVVLKGAHTSIADPAGTVWFNSTGNPGMARGGSGDVLTGILTGLLAQGYPASEAAIIGVFIHGRAGDLAAEKIGQNSMIAGDLVEFLGQSFGR